MSSALSCRDLSAGHAGRPVVHRVSLEVGTGEILAVLGPNGAGKTTTLATLAGLLPGLGGTVRLGDPGEDVSRLGPAARSRRGLVLVPDDRALFGGLTARQHLRLAARRGGLGLEEVLGYFPELSPRLDVAAGMLSGGEQQMLAIGRALAQRPKVLLIDELSLGLAPLVTERLLTTIRRIVIGTAASVILVEQHVALALGAADRAVVMVHGEIVMAGAAAALLDDPARLARAYLSGTRSAPASAVG
ncbi:MULTISPECIES: ABC transporter ATP-binding protein [unclassified Pseudofrankia]|uniref:ABC transporter ATP-binding protein n=1 Tax=unclassified Pseudofrankia TaxID=2994372 RepID=UPI0008D9BAC8|nr:MULTISPECIES: ATP-binding cassette domain-containing protein [unclassified Pseudofrankia]MDT3439993.1 ATP-binding cassette domain-containing protein [Pseudofrankia sp. BMG5.37]OHV48448.1 ABC transporter ATP-binding protein [Pseudofrankia sp. BMG5.36]